jgi:long-chain acyl-CoA synthetase
MREEPAMPVTPLTTLPAANLLEPLWAHAARHPEHALLAVRDGDAFRDVAAGTVADRVRRLAAGLIGLGIQPGERVALMSRTRMEWTLLDYAILAAGAVTVPIYETSSAEQIAWIMSDSEAVAIIVETAEHADLVAQAGELPACRHVFVIDDGALDTITAQGMSVRPGAVDERVAAIGHGDLATIIYTSGTTGRPKGCVLTQGNLCTNVAQAAQAWREVLRDDDSTLLFLPLAHSFAKIVALVLLDRGVKIAYATDQTAVPEELLLVRPTLLVGVPRSTSASTTRRSTRPQRGQGRIFDLAARHGGELRPPAARRGTRAARHAAGHGLFDRLAYGKLRAAFGGRLRVAVSAGAPLGERLGHFFNGIGVKLLEGYGLTETSPVLSTNTPDDIGIGTVGAPVPGTEIRIAPDGEILCRGPQVFAGYWHNDAATREVIDADGWFHTGDLGELDRPVRVRITGREEGPHHHRRRQERLARRRSRTGCAATRSSPIRRRRRRPPYIAALIALDAEALAEWAAEHGKTAGTADPLRDDPDLRAEIDTAVAGGQPRGVPGRGDPPLRLLPRDLTIAGGELTPTMKVRRTTVLKEYEQAVEELYLSRCAQRGIDCHRGVRAHLRQPSSLRWQGQ